MICQRLCPDFFDEKIRVFHLNYITEMVGIIQDSVGSGPIDLIMEI